MALGHVEGNVQGDRPKGAKAQLHRKHGFWPISNEIKAKMGNDREIKGSLG